MAIKIYSTLYMIKGNKLEIPLTVTTFTKMIVEQALIDSGATENFINYKTAQQVKLSKI
jgi:hypothetical protein